MFLNMKNHYIAVFAFEKLLYNSFSCYAILFKKIIYWKSADSYKNSKSWGRGNTPTSPTYAHVCSPPIYTCTHDLKIWPKNF